METSRDGAMDDFRMDWAEIRNRILKAGEKAGLKDQTAIARAAGGKLKQQEISALGEIKNGKQCTITAEKLARIARVCGVSLDYLIFGEQGNKPEHDETWDTLRPYGESILHMIKELNANLSVRTYTLPIDEKNDYTFDGVYVISEKTPYFCAMTYLSIDIPLFPFFTERDEFREAWSKAGFLDRGRRLYDLTVGISHAFKSKYRNIQDKEVSEVLNEYGIYPIPCDDFSFPWEKYFI